MAEIDEYLVCLDLELEAIGRIVSRLCDEADIDDVTIADAVSSSDDARERFEVIADEAKRARLHAIDKITELRMGLRDHLPRRKGGAE